MSLAVQQDILDNIFKVYEEHNEEFFTNISNKEYDKKHLNELYNKLEKLNESLFNYDVIIVPETFTEKAVDGSDITTTKFIQKVIDNPYRVKGEVSQDIIDYFEFTDELKILRELNKLPQGHPDRAALVARLPESSQGGDYVARAQQLNNELTRIGEAYKNMSDEEKLAVIG